MTSKLDEILNEVKESRNEGKQLKSWLYGENGFEGDIPTIKELLSTHSRRIRTIELVVIGLIISGGGALGIIQLFS